MLIFEFNLRNFMEFSINLCFTGLHLGWRLHSLKGDHAGLWAVNISGNWRVVFEFKDGHAYVVNYEDYH